MQQPTVSKLNPEFFRDLGEAAGIPALTDEVAGVLAHEIEYRIGLIIETALKFMRARKRSVCSAQDVSASLRTLNVEPLYGYETTRPLRFGEATLGLGQPLFYVEDEEQDLERLINAPLPTVPRDATFTGE
jgi:transcription initiation factor TFIID subunit 6